MLATTTETIPGKEVEEILGIVKGSTVRARCSGKDILAGLRNVIGGELKEYSEMLTEAGEQAMQRMVEEARALGADAVVNVRFVASPVVVHGAAEQPAAPRR